MILLSHPTGNENVRQVYRALAEGGRLAGFCTSICWRRRPFWNRVIPAALRRQLERRSLPGDFDVPVFTAPWREGARLLFHPDRVGRTLGGFLEPWLGIDQVYRSFDRRVARRIDQGAPADGVYAYEDGALESFRSARSRGMRTYYDLPIAHWELKASILAGEAERRPEWAPTLAGAEEPAWKRERKDEELALAETVICPSQFVADSLPPAVRRSARVEVCRFGCDPPGEPEGRDEEGRRRALEGGPLRVLFAGAMTQRKGLADLFEAVGLVGSGGLELVVLGSPVLPLRFYRSQCSSFVYEAPLARAGVLELMRSCDVFVLPSLVEGRALVQLEALSSGLPLIVTENTGGEDLVTEGETGFTVPVGDAPAIAEKLTWFLENRGRLPAMAAAARERARAVSWERYRAGVLRVVQGAGVPVSHG